MGFSAGSADVGEEAAGICGVPEGGVLIRNTGDATVYFGGPGVGTDGGEQGYPVEPGSSETFPGAKPKESPVVPAPEGDMDLAVLYGRTAAGQSSRVSFISVSMT